MKSSLPSNFLQYWKLAIEVDNHFDGSFSLEEFKNISDTFQGLDGSKQRINVCSIFKKLPKEEVVRRTTIAAKLTRLLLTIKINAHDLHNRPIYPQPTT